MNAKYILLIVVIGILITGFSTIIGVIIDDYGITNPFLLPDNAVSDAINNPPSYNDELFSSSDSVSTSDTGFFSTLSNFVEGLNLITNNRYVRIILSIPFSFVFVLTAIGLPVVVSSIIMVIIFVIFTFLILSWLINRS